MIRVDALSFCWPGSDAALFSGVNLEFAAGKTTCLLGPNGSGKTTLLELILGWRNPGSGRVLLDGVPVSDIPVRDRGRSMALVPQDERLPFAYSVLDYVLLGRAAYLAPLAAPVSRDRDIARGALEMTGISRLEKRSIPRLSGGELRLVLIARALTQQPRVLLLDEPTNHLDPANRERIIGVLESLHNHGITLIMTTHDPDLVLRLAGSIVLVKAGKAPEAGSLDSLFTPEHLSALYGVPVRIGEVEGRRVLIWGN